MDQASLDSLYCRLFEGFKRQALFGHSRTSSCTQDLDF